MSIIYVDSWGDDCCGGSKRHMLVIDILCNICLCKQKKLATVQHQKPTICITMKFTFIKDSYWAKVKTTRHCCFITFHSQNTWSAFCYRSSHKISLHDTNTCCTQHVIPLPWKSSQPLCVGQRMMGFVRTDTNICIAVIILHEWMTPFAFPWVFVVTKSTTVVIILGGEAQT